ncbi:MAG: integrase arm-type DNA-binding domain-containing protein [Burkholderiaceae bacterium]
MPKRAKERSALEVQRLVAPGFHAVGVVAGLHLRVKPTGARSWILRATVGDLRRDIGLGAYPDVTLAQARDKAREAREAIVGGTDPVHERQERESALRAAQAKAMTFDQATTAYIESQETAWKNPKSAQQWTNSLNRYAFPVIGKMHVGDVELAHILKILEPIWKDKTVTATRVRGRIEKVLNWAKGRGHRTGDNPAAWKGNLEAQLAQPQKITAAVHHAALPLGEVSAFMHRLRGAEGMGARALEFLILTAARSGEARGATWAEIDLDAKVWTVPASRMKMKKEHRVPLSEAAIKLLRKLPRVAGTDLVFPSPRNLQLSDMTLTAVLRRLDVPAVPHGFRSTFRDWASERTSYPRDAAEMALAHAIGDKVEAAYRRGDLFEKRRKMMDDWARFCSQIASVRATVLVLARSA